MKNLKKMLGILALGLFAMMFTSCKAKVGGGEFSLFWQILAIIMWFIAIAQEDYMLPKKQGVFLRICGIFYFLLFLGGILFPFIWAPLPYIPKISLGVAALFWLIGMIKGAPVKAQKEAEAKAKAEAEARIKAEEEAEAEAKAKAEAEVKAKAEAEKKAKDKAEAEAKAKAEADEKAKQEAEAKAAKEKQLEATKAALTQMESDLEAKKAEVASLGMDAQSIVKKAKLNKEIKELEPQIETLKAEVERLSK